MLNKKLINVIKYILMFNIKIIYKLDCDYIILNALSYLLLIRLILCNRFSKLNSFLNDKNKY